MRVWQSLTMAFSALCLSALTTEPLNAQGVTGPAFVLGSLRADSTKTPIVGAELVLTSVGRTTRTDSTGAFAFRELPAGRHRMMVRAVGFQTITVNLDVPSDGVDDVHMTLQRAINELQKVDVKASGGIRTFLLNGFEERRKLGIGRFLDSTVLGDVDPKRWASVVMERIPGVRLINYSGRRSFASTRGAISFQQRPKGDSFDAAQGAPPNCYVQIVVDGLQRYGSRVGEPLLDVNNLEGPFVAAEYYTVSETPLQFNREGNAPCGTLLLWTGR
jgi:hypothetical protein